MNMNEYVINEKSIKIWAELSRVLAVDNILILTLMDSFETMSTLLVIFHSNDHLNFGTALRLFEIFYLFVLWHCFWVWLLPCLKIGIFLLIVLVITMPMLAIVSTLSAITMSALAAYMSCICCCCWLFSIRFPTL